MENEKLNLVNAARNLLQAAGFFVDQLWHRNDVHFICEQLGIPRLNEDEVAQVFAIASEQFDGDTGISWPQLERALHAFQQRKSAVNALCPPKRIEAIW
ncbi:MAG: hypothetical protein K2Q01_06960 [Rickettsiales bacterium]|nr:hypothetical protein [Rickettsiales bacterium]